MKKINIKKVICGVLSMFGLVYLIEMGIRSCRYEYNNGGNESCAIEEKVRK